MQNEEAKNKPSVIVYTHSLLAGSMTFIKSHGEALRRFRPIYAGAHRVQGLELPPGRFCVVNNGGAVGTLKEYFFRELNLAPGFVRRLKQERPAIVHTHFGVCGPSGMFLADRLNVPLVVTFHGKDATATQAELARSRRGRSFLRNEDALIRRTDKFIAVSEYIRSKLIDRGYPDEKILVHKNGIDLDFFSPRDNKRRSDLVVFVGRFTEKKGIEFLIRAAAKIAEQGRKFELVLIGDGPLRPSLERAATDAGINCSFPGFLPIEDVKEWIGKATCVAVPSVVAKNGDSEGLPTILLEAQAMQTPIVSTFHSGIPEGVRDGVTAYLVQERDVDALADRISRFLAAPEQSRAFGVAGRKFIAGNFDLQKQVEGLEELYSRLISEFRQRGR